MISKWILALVILIQSIAFAKEENLGRQKSARREVHDPVARQWMGTGLKPYHLFLDDTLNSKNCMQSERVFKACLESLSFLAQEILGKRLKAKVLVAPMSVYYEALKKGQPWSLLQDFGSFGLFKMGEQAVTRTLSIENALDNMAHNWKEFTRDQVRQGQHLDSCFDYFTQLVRTESDLDPYFVSQVLNLFFYLSEDPHNRLENELALMEMSNAQLDVKGFGIDLRLIAGKIRIERVYEGSSADEARLSPGDVILEVNSEAPEKTLISENPNQNLCSAGCRFKIQRGPHQFSVNLKPRKFIVESLIARDFTVRGQPIFYARLRDFFNMDDCTRFRQHLATAEKLGFKGILLDLRGNPGGQILESICFVSSFLNPSQEKMLGGAYLKFYHVGSKAIDDVYSVFSVDMMNRDFLQQAKSKGLDVKIKTQLPLVVLVDSNSASASEIVAGTIQETQRGWIVGQKTFGKGSFQERSLKYWNGVHRVFKFETKGLYLLPSGRSPQLRGIQPDFEYLFDPDMNQEGEETLREKDLFYGTHPEFGPDWSHQPNPQISRVKKCLFEISQAADIYRKTREKKERLHIDYQTMSGLEVLYCEIVHRNQ